MNDFAPRPTEYDTVAAAGAAAGAELPQVDIGTEDTDRQPEQPSYAEPDTSGVIGVGYEDDAGDAWDGGEGEPRRAEEPADDIPESVVTKAARDAGLVGDPDAVMQYSGAIGHHEDDAGDTRGVSERVHAIGAAAREAAGYEPDQEVDLSDPDVRRAVLGDELADAYDQLGLGDVVTDGRPVETVTTTIFDTDTPTEGVASPDQDTEATAAPAGVPESDDAFDATPRNPIEERTDTMVADFRAIENGDSPDRLERAERVVSDYVADGVNILLAGADEPPSLAQVEAAITEMTGVNPHDLPDWDAVAEPGTAPFSWDNVPPTTRQALVSNVTQRLRTEMRAVDDDIRRRRDF